jgi:hypothetical protein
MRYFQVSRPGNDPILIPFQNAPCPAGRNANGCAQKILKIKNALRAEIDAVKKGGSIATAGASYATPKKTGGRKRKTATDEDSEGTPKKRGRAKKNADPEMEAEVTVKNEPEGELSIEEEEEEV